MNLPEGYTARPPGREDLDIVVGLLDTRDIALFGEANSNREGVQYGWGAPWVNLERDVRLINAGDGSLVAYAEHATPDPAERWEVEGCVHPAHEGRGIGSAILAWTEMKSRTEAGPGTGVRIWNSTGASNDRGLLLFADRGYQHIRTSLQMRIDLDPSFSPGPIPEGVTVRRQLPGTDDRAVHAGLEEAFSSSFGHVAEPFDVWLEHQLADESFDPGRGFVAEVEGQIVGVSMNGVSDGTGWVYELGVRGPWQGRGIGRALLRHSLALFAAEGVETARLGVDTENPSGALELYRSVGMRQVREWRLFEKLLEPG